MIVFLTLSEPGHQMLRHILFWPFTALALLWSPFCLPMQTHFESLDDVLGKTRLAAVADILSVADQREWDDFESTWLAGRQAWLLRHPEDPRATELRDELDVRLREYVGVYRDVFGFAYLILGR